MPVNNRLKKYRMVSKQLFQKIVLASLLLFSIGFVFSAPCDLKNSPPAFVRHDLTASPATSVSYCELCGYGYVSIIVSNPYVGDAVDATDMTSMSVVENLLASGLSYDPTAPTPIRYRVNGGAYVAGGAPAISGVNGSVLTWTAAQIAPLNLLAPLPGINSFSTITITFAVKRVAALGQEGLVAAVKQIRSSLTYSTSPACVVNSTVNGSLDALPLREPIPVITKAGRNVDAGQTSYTNPLYATNNDDVIWRVQIRNSGLADMQDMRFDDLMQNGSMVIKYACPTEAAALAVANNNGVAPVATTCVASSNNVNDFIVNGLFSNPDNTIVDVPKSGGITNIYFPGVVNSNAACTAKPDKSNTVADVQWGCDGEGAAGGITTTSTGVTPGGSATLSTLVTPANLTITANLTGTNTAQPVGSKGLMTITIRNNSGGAVKNVKLSDVLPLEYVVDSTFTPTFQMIHPAGYGDYAGMVNTLVWTNPVAATFPLTTTNPLVALANTNPAFSLTSAAPHTVAVVNANDATQFNMLRHGDRVVITFRVVLIKSSNYDRVANLDVLQESPLGTPCCTDPNNQSTTLTNILTVSYEDFCSLGTTNSVVGSPFNQNYNAFPEDLDIDISGSVFILTNDPLQPVTLPVLVSNRGGHDAADYHVFVTFGGTMQVTVAPSGCTPIAISGTPPQPVPFAPFFPNAMSPEPLRVWTLPAAIPDPSKYPTVYHCVPGGDLPNPMSPGTATTLNFEVIKVRPTDSNYAARIIADDLSFRADVVGEVTLTGYPAAPATPVPIPLWFPTPIIRADGQTDRANNYSLDAIRARVIGFNLSKNVLGNCSENPLVVDRLVQIGEECTFHIDTGGWFGFQTPGFTYIAVQNVTVTDQLPITPGVQGYISSTDPALTSTSQVKGFALTRTSPLPQVAPAALDQGWIDWKFNQVGPLSNRITQRDEWFSVNNTNRILNSPVDSSSSPNYHSVLSTNVLNSTFEAVFNNASTGLEEIYLLGQSTVGYPQAFARTVNMTVTEPNLTVVKSVCNESVSAGINPLNVGANCSPFSTTATGDTYDNYVYKISVTNGASSNSVARAPAYDVVVTDVLDASDLEYVVPFSGDNIDNDGDGATDESGVNSEGAISENVVKSGGPAVINFSYTHSTALQKINPGATVNLYYRVDPDKDVQPGQQLVSSVTTSYDSLSGTSGAQTSPVGANSTIGGARVYTTSPVNATVQMITPSILPKKILQLSQPNHATPVWPTIQPVSIGEEIQYEFHIDLPIANLRSFIIRDDLPSSLHCSEAPSVTLPATQFSPGGTFAPHCVYGDSYVEWNFGDQALINGTGITTYPLAVNFIARVENTSTTNNGDTISNGGASTVGPASVATAKYTTKYTSGGPDVPVTLTYTKADVQIQEPRITLTKTFSQSSADAADLITVTVSATNNTAGNLATAYNLQVRDDLTLATHLSYAGSITSITGLAPTAATTGAVTTFSWPAGNAIAFGETRSFSYKIQVAIGAQPMEILSNAALNPMQAKWDSLPGSSTKLNTLGALGADGAANGLRNGVLPNAGSTLNDYETIPVSYPTLTVPAITMTKTDLSTGVVPAIGAYKNFQIVINLPEGTSQTVTVADNLAAGSLSYLLEKTTPAISYTYQGISSVNGGVAIGDPTNSTGTATWDFGTVVTTSENDLATTVISPSITINYSARIDNTASADAGNTMQNSAVASYRNGSTGGTSSSAAATTAAITVVEPLLTVSKSVVNFPMGGVPVSGNTLRYTLVISAASGATRSTAYDVSITDTISASLQYRPGTAKLDGAVLADPVITTGTILNWSLANANANIDIPAGGSVTLVYDIEVLNQPGTNLTNATLVQWSSLDGAGTYERDGSGYSAGSAYNDYYTTASVSSPPFADTTTFAKTRIADTYGTGDANVRIGEVVDFQLTINLPEGTTLASAIVDTLPKGLKFESIVSVNANTTAPFGSVVPFTHTAIASPTVSGNPLTGSSTVTWNIGDIVNASNGITTDNDFVIVYRTRVLNDVLLQGAGAAQTITNSALLNYTAATTTGITRTASLTLQQPYLTVTKTSSPVTGSTIVAGDVVSFTVTITNGSTVPAVVPATAPAYDIQLRDTLPSGMRVGGVTMTSTTLNGSGVANVTPVYNATTGEANWNFDTGVANAYTINPGNTLQLVYTAKADAGVGTGLSMGNLAQVQDYCSFDNDATPTAGGVNGVRQCYGISNTATSTLITATANPLGKVNVQATAAIGAQFKYRITVPATAQTTALYDVRILDDLATSAADISYVGLTQVSGPTWTPVVTESPAKNLVISGSGTGLDIPAGQQAVFDITVVLNDSVTNVSGLSFQNIASYTFNQFNNDNATQVSASANAGVATTMTVVGPALTMLKSGPTTMSVGVPGTFTLDVQNTGTGTAWDVTLEDRLPSLAQGGMCDVAPTIASVINNGVTLSSGTDYTTSFTPAAAAPSYCTLKLIMTSAAASIAPTRHLIVTYQASLNLTTLGGLSLTNIAAATQWFSGDTVANVATGQIKTYTGLITDGTTGTTDSQDAHLVTTEAPLLQFLKSVRNMTTGQTPGTNASPGDVLRYTLTIKNVSILPLNNFGLTDELDRVNATAMFMPGSINLISIPAGASATLTNSSGGSKGTGLVDIRNMNIGAKNAADDTLTIVYEARLAAVITSGTTVLNQAQLPISVIPLDSDDPNVNGSHDPSLATPGPIDATGTLISSAPSFQVRKSSLDITADPLVLLAGERLRYTITVKNIGSENTSGVTLRDPLPPNTTYVAGTTQLNGAAVADVGTASALQAGMLIHAPENVTAGIMRADASTAVTNVATITFEVQINSNVLNGTIISNQGFVNGSGLGSGLFAEKRSDDISTAAADDPTLNVVGNFPLLLAQKTVAVQHDYNGDGILDAGDILRYTITISNLSSIPATGVTLTDLVPLNTSYIPETNSLLLTGIGGTTLNTVVVADGGVLPSIAGMGVESLASPPGTIAAHSSAVVTFDVQVNAGVTANTVISNQGSVTSTELPLELTDADGNTSNGHQPTTIMVGYAQQLSITKQVTVVGGGAALAGGQLEYLVRVINSGTVPATSVVISDNLSLIPFNTQVSYVSGSATLNGVAVSGSVLSAPFGTLAPGASAILRFRVTINPGLVMGTTITNTGQVTWNTPTLTATAAISIDVGGVPGSANLNGHVWLDSNHDRVADSGEINMAGWTVTINRNNIVLGSTLTDSNGLFTVTGLTPTAVIADEYALSFSAPGAVATTAKLGRAYSVYTNGLQQIGAIVAFSGSSIQNLNLPITPNGVVYNSILRTPATGMLLTMARSASPATPLPVTCFDDPFQQGQVTLPSGYYKFDLNFSDPACQPNDDYLIRTTSPAAYMPGQSLIIPPLTDLTTAAISVPVCAAPATLVPATVVSTSIPYCEALPSDVEPGVSVAANSAGTNYFLRMVLGNAPIPRNSQMFNNHIAVDPRLDNAVTISKVSPLQNVTKGQHVPYTITINNTLAVTLTSMNLVDTFPPGFKYVVGSGRMDGLPVEPVATTRTLTWGNLQLVTNTKHVFQLMLIVGSGVKEGKYVNRAQMINAITGGAGSPEATSTVRVIPDPTLDCSDVIGKVFDDANLNGYQDEGEKGLPGVRVVTARGLIVTADKFGRFHLTCAVVPDPDRGSNYILKVDDRSLPSGYRLTTENPRVQRATRGKMLKFNFGAALHKVVKLDMADAVFEPDSTEMRVQWKGRFDLLTVELKKAASVLRLSYLAETESEKLVEARLKRLKQDISKLWIQKNGNYDLTIETEIFWRSGAPPVKSEITK